MLETTLRTNFDRVAFTLRLVPTPSSLFKGSYIDRELQGGLVRPFLSTFLSPIAPSGL
jgi:hypothetical protein